MNLLKMSLLIAVTLVMLTGAAGAEESWVTDPKTGAKIGWDLPFFTLTSASWSGPVADGKADGKGLLTVAIRAANGESYTGQLDAEMVAGKLHGRGRAKFSNGDTYDGYFADGRLEGRGVYRWGGRGGYVYDGEYKRGLPDGYGVYKDPKGKVLYEGQWTEGVPVTRPALDKVLGIPWGATEDAVKKSMLARPRTALRYSWKDGSRNIQQYWGPFNDRDHWIFFRFNEGRLYAVAVHLAAPESQLDQIMELMETTRRGLTERYGPADAETGKYIDTQLGWFWPNRYMIALSVQRMPNAPAPAFGMWLVYAEVNGFLKAEGKAASGMRSDY